MRHVKKLCRSRKGATLLEVLFAFLIVALSAGLFASAVGAAARINASAIRQREAFFQELTAAETGAYSVAVPVRLKVRVTGSADYSGSMSAVEIVLNTGKDDGTGLIYYRPKPTTGGGP